MTSSSENQRAGLFAVVAAGAGLIAVIAVVVAANQGEPIPGEPLMPAELGARGLGSGGPLAEGPGGAAEPVAVSPDASRRSDAGERMAEGLPDLTAPEPGSILEGRILENPSTSAPPSDEGSALTAPRVPAPELTPEQRYEAHAFLEDMVVLRIDTLRREIAEARRIGDGRALRRLEPALTVLEEESVRLAARRRELERELPRPPAEGEPEDRDEPAPIE